MGRNVKAARDANGIQQRLRDQGSRARAAQGSEVTFAPLPSHAGPGILTPPPAVPGSSIPSGPEF